MNTISQEETILELLRRVALGAEPAGNVMNAAAAASSTGSSSIEGIAGKELSSVFGSGFGLSPFIGGLMKLFGGGGDEALPPVVKYAPPDPLAFPLGFSRAEGGATNLLDYARGGIPRLVATAGAATRTSDPTPDQDPWQARTSPDAPSRATASQVTIQVQAMDSRSFLDHSDDIANAVREALLRTHSLNDVIAEL